MLGHKNAELNEFQGNSRILILNLLNIIKMYTYSVYIKSRGKSFLFVNEIIAICCILLCTL